MGWLRLCRMPTFFNPGGRTLAGGDMMPFVIPCPKADAARIRINARIWLLRTADPFVCVVAFAPPGLAFYLALTQRLRAGLMNSALRAVAGILHISRTLVNHFGAVTPLPVLALGPVFTLGPVLALLPAAPRFAVPPCSAALATRADSGITGNPRWATRSMACSIGMRTMPAFWSTQS